MVRACKNWQVGVNCWAKLLRIPMSHLRQRLIDIMMQARRNSQPIHVMEAEQLVWQQIEEELFQSSLWVANKSVENNQEV